MFDSVRPHRQQPTRLPLPWDSLDKNTSGLPFPSPVNILGISKLKWTGMGEFNSDDHYIYYCGQESLRKNGVAIIVNQRVQNAVLGSNLKNDRMISVHFQGIQYHGNPSLWPNQ